VATSDSTVEAAVLELFDECAPPLHRYVGSLGIGGPDTEDVVQDVFLSLFRHLAQGKSRSNLKGWLFTVAHNLALKHRARAKRRIASVDGDFASAAEPADPATSVELELARIERQQRLLRVLRALPERDRQCLCLRAEGMRYREIAEVMGMSLGAVSKSLARSISRMVSADDASV
jgi:RNA polymerase sigma-70 factor, ECF subfamily